jgi:hypothetical protein
MSSSYPTPPTFRTTLRSFAQAPDLPFADLLTEADIQAACDRHRVAFAAAEHHIWTPALTLWTFLSQCVSDAKDCAAAVARAIALRVSLGLPPCSDATGGYCKARAKLPVPLLSELATQLGGRLEQEGPPSWRWKNRRVLFADGTTLSGPDTAANQAAYPQPPSQKPGLGFPLIRMVVLMGFATAALVDARVGPWSGKEAGEMGLFRELFDRFRPGDVFVADRAYCSYWLLAALRARGADVATRLHQSRHYDFRTGRPLGEDDHVVTWSRPARPAWMDKSTYRAVPKTLTVREVRFRVERPGYRTQEILVATTLTDPTDYSREDLADLYHQRWRVELKIRDLKQALGMDVLRGKTPDMLGREIWAHLLAYNLIRQVMARAAQARGCSPRRLSFTGAKHTLDAFRVGLQAGDETAWGRQVEALVRAIGGRRVGGRPGRSEPREVKRRPKDFPLMTRPRATGRAALLSAAQNGPSDAKTKNV